MTVSDAICQTRDWDSTFFGYRIAQVNGTGLDAVRAAAVDAWCTRHQIDMVSFLTDASPEVIHTAETSGYHWVDTHITYERDLSRFPIQPLNFPAGLSWRMANKRDAETLIALAAGAFPYSRFAADPHFSAEQNDALYQLWVEKSIDGGFDSGVLILEYNGVIVSFMSFKIDETQQTGHLRLMSTNPEYRRTGLHLGTNTVSATVHYLAQQGMKNIEVVAQLRNIAAQRIYQHLSFRLRNMQSWYHKWYF